MFDSPNECKGDDSQTEGLRLKNPVSCSPGSSHPMTNSGSICSTGEESPPTCCSTYRTITPCLNIHQ
ncbi:hypothetical protein NP493_1247g00068 [Ridgeia piscesae]|uniref:Uncharacterized protein n=1 Tax=Ridgeia piscesae TaxID=27915 RepID=A0AAD9NF76_RIDPI|nr:hypothetical protein NP493_1247g00068 [Ridgeia piscesae]